MHGMYAWNDLDTPTGEWLRAMRSRSVNFSGSSVMHGYLDEIIDNYTDGFLLFLTVLSISLASLIHLYSFRGFA